MAVTTIFCISPAGAAIFEVSLLGASPDQVRRLRGSESGLPRPFGAGCFSLVGPADWGCCPWLATVRPWDLFLPFGCAAGAAGGPLSSLELGGSDGSLSGGLLGGQVGPRPCGPLGRGHACLVVPADCDARRGSSTRAGPPLKCSLHLVGAAADAGPGPRLGELCWRPVGSAERLEAAGIDRCPRLEACCAILGSGVLPGHFCLGGPFTGRFGPGDLCQVHRVEVVGYSH
ncbi:hypothetical protein NDU88_010779 [Pleurodeles waltl]|uniref:Uncharacterized protein n=1 Tax=Pleurodeles waltl TaxID=8319 RepID=A0AAV7Q379_PLEWA|nr:hypothetical protein NDU88_010779 [Pleurodeles waltl]